MGVSVAGKCDPAWKEKKEKCVGEGIVVLYLGFLNREVEWAAHQNREIELTVQLEQGGGAHYPIGTGKWGSLPNWNREVGLTAHWNREVGRTDHPIARHLLVLSPQ